MKNPIEVRTILLYKLDIKDLIPTECRIPMQIEKINNENIFKVINFRDSNVVNLFKDMLDNGEIGVYGIFNQKAVGHTWAIINSSNIVKAVEQFYKTKLKMAYIHFGYVKEELRGNNIGPYILTNLMKFINETYNIDIFYIDTDNSNAASQKSIIKTGFKLYRKYKFISIRGHIINRKNIR